MCPTTMRRALTGQASVWYNSIRVSSPEGPGQCPETTQTMVTCYSRSPRSRKQGRVQLALYPGSKRGAVRCPIPIEVLCRPGKGIAQ